MRGDDKKVAFSTTSYHVFRSGNIAHSIGLDAEGIGSKTKWYFYTNALIREFVANINSQKRQHVINNSSFAVVHQISHPLNHHGPSASRRYDALWTGANARARLLNYQEQYEKRYCKRYDTNL